ncbi:MAG: lipocalin-like domain-containing protein [Pseudomonadota bacterium]
MAQDTPLIGTRTLEGWFNQADDGTRAYPFGQNPTGNINYSHDGFVFVHMAKADRAAFAVPNDPFGGSEAEGSTSVPSGSRLQARWSIHF